MNNEQLTVNSVQYSVSNLELAINLYKFRILINLIVIIGIMLASGNTYIAAQSYDQEFQNYSAKVQNVLKKSVEMMSEGDLAVLREAMSKGNTFFGNEYQHSMKNLKQQAREKLGAHQEYLDKKEAYQRDIAEKTSRLTETESILNMTQAQRDSVIKLNEQLRVEIAKLQKRISGLTKERNEMEKTNKKLMEENEINSKMLADVRRMMSRMQAMMAFKREQSEEVQMALPQTLKDSLNNIECGVSESMVNNFTLTLHAMQHDGKYMDSVSEVFSKEQKLPADLDDYIQKGIMLSGSMEQSESECVRKAGTDISESIDEFMAAVKEHKAGKFPWMWVIIGGAVVVAAVIIALIMRGRKKAV